MNALESTFAKLEARMIRATGAAPERPTPTPVPETKGDVTTRAAKAILDAETEARNAKIAALRTARLEGKKG
ncbi:hypothetical protein CLV79_10288 [Limimaricola soesokkakensis]|uniref:Uncharacterized protein n=1 Tax=Limimaricola soesokkakensis TaxID=1343159 RepID=A0A1X6YV53_9RHOB|nr:hypothetical protein [Limimaricola soesokkakensis]PSK87606.1 hypothetical protein CLV79_10288 [Limimaricola soesokkakensis]SLN31735.1 hypothetical protein LOS8367_01172 [Limimaricola soesokkakensis]